MYAIRSYYEKSSGVPLYSSDPSFIFPSEYSLLYSLNDYVAVLSSDKTGKVYDVSSPLYGPAGELAGRVRIGFLDTILISRIASSFRRSLIILGVAFFAVVITSYSIHYTKLYDPLSGRSPC